MTFQEKRRTQPHVRLIRVSKRPSHCPINPTSSAVSCTTPLLANNPSSPNTTPPSGAATTPLNAVILTHSFMSPTSAASVAFAIAYATNPVTNGVAILVPYSALTTALPSAPDPGGHALTMFSPGAYTSTQGPVLLNEEIVALGEILPTTRAAPAVPPMLDGEKEQASEAALPAAIMTWIPAVVAAERAVLRALMLPLEERERERALPMKEGLACWALWRLMV